MSFEIIAIDEFQKENISESRISELLKKIKN
jgi:predicted HTH domain antitoxin